jgi:hypothetical protein
MKSSNQKVPTLSSLGVDIGKNVFHLVGFDWGGMIAILCKINRCP